MVKTYPYIDIRKRKNQQSMVVINLTFYLTHDGNTPYIEAGYILLCKLIKVPTFMQVTYLNNRHTYAIKQYLYIPVYVHTLTHQSFKAVE